MIDLDAITGQEMQVAQDPGTRRDGPGKRLEQPAEFWIPEVQQRARGKFSDAATTHFHELVDDAHRPAVEPLDEVQALVQEKRADKSGDK